MADFTEKQLEDWLTENWATEHSKALFPYMPESLRPVELVGRQVRCKSGTIDLLAFSLRTFLVIELKSTTADERVIEQVMRYQHAVERAAMAAEFDISLSMGMGYPSGEATMTSLVVIAPRFTAKALNTLYVIGSPVIVSFDGHEFAFSVPGVEIAQPSAKLREVLRPYVASAIGREIGEKANNTIKSSSTFFVCEN